MNEQYDIKDSSLIEEIISHMNNSEYRMALDLIHKRLLNKIDINQRKGAFLKVDLAGFLIDIGSEGFIEEEIRDGLKIFEEDMDSFRKFITESSIEYNFGNAKSGLFRIQRKNKDLKFSPENIELLIEAKNHYWKSFKKCSSHGKDFNLKLLTNLANSLDTCGRVVESLQYYDLALKEDPNFLVANFCRSQALIWLNHLSGGYSINQLFQAMQGFDRASQCVNMPKSFVEDSKSKRELLREKLKNRVYSSQDIVHDLEETKAEAESHSAYRKFCLENKLCLSEHSLYCNCIGAGSDNITIPRTCLPIGGTYVPRMEFILNRIKSEFYIARLMYYESCMKDQKKWESYEREVSFTELYENESIGIYPEMLRTSFRLCFGILDKISYGVCELFNLAEPDEPIAFERFWKPQGKNLSKKQQERWNIINSIDNHPLLALYSQATDLNSKTGEWRDFKEWRNSLEHEILFLKNFSCSEKQDLFGSLKFSRPILFVDYSEFREKTLHLLQFARAAIMYFVFCVRMEGEKDNKKLGIPITLSPKIVY